MREREKERERNDERTEMGTDGEHEHIDQEKDSGGLPQKWRGKGGCRGKKMGPVRGP